MKWLKDAYLDVVVLLIIALYAFYPNDVLNIVLWVYTVLLLISKLLTFVMPTLNSKANKTSAPPLFYHLVYGLTVAILFYVENLYLGGAWILIWGVSVISFLNTKKSKS
ncbi:hypothetical protein ACKGJO_03895 [Gracilimonas sp. Q87]|uniref:hypothetical protein n=1 Tax=Gracilimonas sp. Q87 TaxID=3384766 RepID=UPI003983E469